MPDPPASSTSHAGIDLDRPYDLDAERITRFREDGFVKLKGVFDKATLDHYSPAITELILAHAPEKPLEQRGTYGKAFIQVGNLWARDQTVKAFAFGKRLARIAAELLGAQGVRMWHDQALYKEPSGGFTPWHADQQYWPMASTRALTAWIPLHAVPLDMGPLCFGKGSHLKNIGRDIAISDESERLIREAVRREGLTEVQEPYELGEVSFHYGYTLHRAGPNQTPDPRKVFTVIYMDQDMRLAEPKNDNQRNDWAAWTPTTQVGAVMDDPNNPILYTIG